MSVHPLYVSDDEDNPHACILSEMPCLACALKAVWPEADADAALGLAFQLGREATNIAGRNQPTLTPGTETSCRYCEATIFLFDKAPASICDESSGWAVDVTGDPVEDFICPARDSSARYPDGRPHEPKQ